MSIDLIFRDDAEHVLKLIERIAARTGDPGTVKARSRYEALRAALGDGDEERVKKEIRGIYTHLSRKNYATDDEYERGKELLAKLPEDLREQIVSDAETGHSEPMKKPRLTIEALETHLTMNQVSAKRNLITHKVELDGWNQSGEYSKEQEADQFPDILHDTLADGYTGCKPEEISRMIAVIAGKHEYNPVLDLLRAEPWDGVDRFPELYRILGLTDTLSQMLVEKWMRQAVALQFNNPANPFGGEGVLVLTAEQGVGKSEFSKRIAELSGTGGFFLPGALLDPADKDSVIQATSRWIVEIGELGSTFNKADMGRLKAFITKPFDTYRVPFGREDISTLRRTSFIATVDRVDFLTDDSGNRRWWVVEVEKIDLDGMDKLDRVQLWRQVLNLIDRDGVQSFRLTREERDKLNQRNAKHEKLIPAEQELRDILAQYRGDVPTSVYMFKDPQRMSASQIADMFYLKYSSQQVGRALNKIGVESGRSNGATWYLFPAREFTKNSANG